MALATRCPNCQAMFRVVSDQLKLRGGLVRCGSCRHVFDAIGSLSYIEDAALSLAPAPAPAAKRAPGTEKIGEPVAASAASARESAATEGVATVPTAPTAPRDSKAADPASLPPLSSSPSGSERAHDASTSPVMARAASSPSAAHSDGPVDPLAVPTLLAPGAGRDASSDAADASAPDGGEARSDATAGADNDTPDAERVDAPVDAQEASVESRGPASDDAPAPRARQRKARARKAEADVAGDADADAGRATGDDEVVAPAFLREAKRRRGFSIVFGGGSLLLAVLLLLQSAVMFRTELITRWPQLRPQLVMLCDLYGCNVGWPTRAELLAVVGTELQAVPGTDILELTAVVRNRASFRVALPAVEVTLTDTTNRTVARKVFAPVDYLASSGEPSSRISEGLGAGSDYVVKITFEARGLTAAGFVVYPFYL